MKLRVFIFILTMLPTGLVVAEENGALSSRTFTTADAGFNLAYGNDQMAEHAIDERIIDRLGLFDRSDDTVPVVPAYRSTWRMKTATGVSKSQSQWNFDSDTRQRGQARSESNNFCRYQKFFVVTASSRGVAA